MSKGSRLWAEAHKATLTAFHKGKRGSTGYGGWTCDTGPGGCHVCIEDLRTELRRIADTLDVPSDELYNYED